MKQWTSHCLIIQYNNHIMQGRRNQSSWSGFGQTTISQGKNKIPFYKKQVINKSARVILDFLGLLYYCTVGRKAISIGRKLLGAHARSLFYVHNIFCCAKVIDRVLVWFLMFGRPTTTYHNRYKSHVSSVKYIGHPRIWLHSAQNC